MKKFLTTLLILVGIGILAMVTCPGKAAHKEAIQNVFKEMIVEELGDNAASSLVAALTGKATGWVVDKLVTVEDHYVCSIGKLQTLQGKKVISVGVFGHVFAFKKDDLGEVLREFVEE